MRFGLEAESVRSKKLPRAPPTLPADAMETG